jgi:lysophospholipase L1-like esterase
MHRYTTTFIALSTFIGLMILTLACSDNSIKKKKEEAISFLALGDSYTIGESVSESEQWPRQLVDQLTDKGLKIDPPRIIAQTGWRTDNMLNVAKSEIKSNQYDLVSLLIGVNNEFQGKSLASFETEFIKCLDYTIAHCSNGKEGVFVLSIPDYGFTPYGSLNQSTISLRIDAYNAICKRVSQEKNIPFFNITPISRKGLDNPLLVAPDGLHPSGLQYKQWINEIHKEVFNLISQ